ALRRRLRPARARRLHALALGRGAHARRRDRGRCGRGGRLAYDRLMAYDEKLAERIRELVSGEPRVTEQKMFGGLAFLIGGNMAIAASGQGGALVHVDPAQGDKLITTTAAEPMEMR